MFPTPLPDSPRPDLRDYLERVLHVCERDIAPGVKFGCHSTMQALLEGLHWGEEWVLCVSLSYFGSDFTGGLALTLIVLLLKIKLGNILRHVIYVESSQALALVSAP